MTKSSRQHALQHQINRLDCRLARLQSESNRWSWIRLAAVFGGGLASAALFFVAGGVLFWAMLIVTLLAFGGAVFAHRQINAAIDRHQIWRRIKQAQLARMTLDWAAIPGRARFAPRAEHPFEADLDLAGEVSLHRLLDVAVSHEGSALLRNWLTDPAPNLADITRRQQLVQELIPRSLFRDRLILNATLASGTRRLFESHRLTAWLEQYRPAPSLRGWLLLFGGLAPVNVLLLALNLAGLANPAWNVWFVLYFGGLLLLNSRHIGDTFSEAVYLQATLAQLSAVFQQLEGFSYRNAPHLKKLCVPLLSAQQRPSRQMARAGRIAFAAGLRQNPVLWLLLNAVLPWDVWVAHRLNHHKAKLAGCAPDWMQVWFELEALGALANLGWLNPHYTLPRVSARPSRGMFWADELGHPLLPDEYRVCNTFALAQPGDVALITGSNMAGKSTFLRTVGLNLALAFAGGPVCAAQMETGLFRLFTSIKVTDSVTNGISYFYAEVKRLRALLAALHNEQAAPLFFLIDEIFRGTNNRERFIGSRAYIRALAGRRGVGLISTHDLELAKLADELPAIHNYHFKDDVSGDRMTFDYRLQPGPCPTTNALKIMAREGLPVDG